MGEGHDDSSFTILAQSRLARDEHWTWCQTYDFFCHAAQEHVLEACTAVGAHDDKIHQLRLRRFEYFVKRHPVHNDNCHFQSSRSDTRAIGFHALHDLCFQVLQVGIREGYTHIRASQRDRLNHMEQR